MILYEAFCSYCKTNPGLKKGSAAAWSGFRDADTGQTVCYGCRDQHYDTKFKRQELTGLYSELPVIIFPITTETMLIQSNGK